MELCFPSAFLVGEQQQTVHGTEHKLSASGSALFGDLLINLSKVKALSRGLQLNLLSLICIILCWLFFFCLI